MSSIATIRRAKRADAKAMAEISRTEIEYGLPPRWSPSRIVQTLGRSDTNAYVCVCNEQLTGFTMASFGKNHVHLLLHAVSPEVRRRGLGIGGIKSIHHQASIHKIA